MAGTNFYDSQGQTVEANSIRNTSQKVLRSDGGDAISLDGIDCFKLLRFTDPITSTTASNGHVTHTIHVADGSSFDIATQTGALPLSGGTMTGDIVFASTQQIDADTVTGFTVGTNVPSDAVFTDTQLDQDGVRAFIDQTYINSLGVDASSVSGFTVGANVPSDAVFTDTQADWDSTDTDSPAFIQNKPTLLELGTTSTTALAGDTDVNNVDIDQYATSTTIADDDFVLFQDVSDSNVPHKITWANAISGISTSVSVDGTAISDPDFVSSVPSGATALGSNEAVLDFRVHDGNVYGVFTTGSDFTPNAFEDIAAGTATFTTINAVYLAGANTILLDDSNRRSASEFDYLIGTTFTIGSTEHTVTTVDPLNANGIALGFTPDLVSQLPASTEIIFSGVAATLYASNILTETPADDAADSTVPNIGWVNSAISSISTGSGLLPTDYTYTANGAFVGGFILAWEAGSADITTGTGTAVTTSTNLATGSTITISNSATGAAGIYRFTDTDNFIYGARAGGPASSNFELLYTFPTGESIARLHGDQLAEHNYNSINYRTILERAEIGRTRVGPVGGEFFKTSEESVLEDLYVSGYYNPTTKVLTKVLRPTIATESEGIWTVTYDGATVNQMPDDEGHPAVAGYGQTVADLANPPASTWQGTILQTNYNDVVWVEKYSITGDDANLIAASDEPNQFGERNIVETADIIAVFRNVYQIDTQEITGFWAINDQGQLVLEDIGRATILGVTTDDFFASTLRDAFGGSQQSGTDIDINQTDAQYLVNGFSVRNNEFYATPSMNLRFTVLIPQQGGLNSISTQLWFDARVNSVVNTQNEQDEDVVRLNVTIRDISDGIKNRPGLPGSDEDNFGDLNWLIHLGDASAVLSRPKASASPTVNSTHLPIQTELSETDAFIPTSEAVIEYVDANSGTIFNGGRITGEVTFENNLLAAPRDVNTARRTISGTVQTTLVDAVSNQLKTIDSHDDVQVGDFFDFDGVTYTINGLPTNNDTPQVQFTPRTPQINGTVDINVERSIEPNFDFSNFNVINLPGVQGNDARIPAPVTVGNYLRTSSTTGDLEERTPYQVYADIIRSHAVTNIQSDFPQDQTSITAVDAIRVSYTLRDNIAEVSVLLDNVVVETVTAGEDLQDGDREIIYFLTQDEVDAVTATTTSVYLDNRYVLQVTFNDLSVHRYQIQFMTDTPIRTDDIHVIGYDFNPVSNVLTTHRHGAGDLTVDLTPAGHIDVSANLPLVISDLLSGNQGYEITYTLPEDVASIQIDFRGEGQGIYNNPSFPTEAGTWTVPFEFVNNASFGTLIRSGDNVYTDGPRGFRLAITPTGSSFPDHYNAHYFLGGEHAPVNNNYVLSGTRTETGLSFPRRGLPAITVTGLPRLSPTEFWGEVLAATARETITAGIPSGFTGATQWTMPDNSLRFKVDNRNSTTGQTQFEWRTGTITGEAIFTKIKL